MKKNDDSNVLDPRSSFNAALWAIHILTSAIYPFIRSGQGTRARGMEGFLAFFAIGLYAATTKSEAMVAYWYAWIIMTFVRMLFPDRRQHTRYQGWPWLTSWLVLGRIGENKLRFLEPFVVLLIAYAVHGRSVMLAKFIGTCALAVAIQNRLGIELRKRQREVIHNAKIEATLYR